MKLRAISEDRPPESYLDPDTWYDTSSAIPFIFIADVYDKKELFIGGNQRSTHYTIVTENFQRFKQIFDQVMEHSKIRDKYTQSIGTTRFIPTSFREVILGLDVAREMCNYLLGRIGAGTQGTVVSFWDKDKRAYDELLGPCLSALEERGCLKKPYYISTPIHGTVPADSTLGTREMSPEELETYELRKQLHLMRGADKQAAMRKLGLGGPKKPHKMQQNLQGAGLLVPGQRWRTPHSESKS